MKKKTFYLVGLVIVVVALTYITSTSFRSSLQYYVTVSEALANQGDYKDKILKIAGTASEINRVEENGKTVYQFKLTEGESVIPVEYRGFVPDTFKDHASVVATGSLIENGPFQATHLLAKCASKYEALIQ